MSPDRSPTPTPPSTPVPPDNEVYETSTEYKCSGCGHVGAFVYSYSEDDACCKECYHRKCGDCVAT
ncbi:hypothetical protein GGR51DRAFT_518893 [Nemania sp. FL0031]|nr:hypothetical protein GGR51DRAFT_518893 [Nemania sp. FL0031]